jgi:hypothetical protein
MPLFDWQCALHGLFEGSHPICPRLGCESAEVTKVWIKPPGVLSVKTKFQDKSLRDIAQTYGLSDLRKPVEGEAQKQAPGLLWGRAGAAKIGMDWDKTVAAASASPQVQGPNGAVERLPNPLEIVAKDPSFGLSKRLESTLPPAAVRFSSKEGEYRDAVKK